MNYLNDRVPEYELTYNDVFMVPSFTDLSSRGDVDLTTPDGLGTSLPIIVANMTAVAGKRMAETTARRGALTVLPQDTPNDILAGMIRYIKTRHAIFDTPITLTATQTINDAYNLINKRSHGTVIVIEGDKPIGIVYESMLAGHDRFTRLGEIMQASMVTVRDTTKPKTIFDTLHKANINYAPVIDAAGKLVGGITKKGALRATLYKPAIDKKGRLLTAAAIGINGNVAEKTKFLLENEIDVLVIDTAHGHQQKMLDAIKIARGTAPKLPIIAGNVASAEATIALINAGADIVKVGIGPGAMCTTRMMTGVGRPQFSAVAECAAAARSLGKHVVADGGIRHPRDVALALAAGASSTMFASWFAGTNESAADIMQDNDGRLYKVTFGMASRRAVKNRSRANSAFDIARKELFEEGISESRIYLSDDAPGVEDIIDQISSGVRSSMTYAGARNIEEFYQKAVIGVQSSAGYEEGRPLRTNWS